MLQLSDLSTCCAISVYCGYVGHDFPGAHKSQNVRVRHWDHKNMENTFALQVVAFVEADSFLKNLVISSWIFNLFLLLLYFSGYWPPQCLSARGRVVYFLWELNALLYTRVLLGLNTHWMLDLGLGQALAAGTLVSDLGSSQGFADGRVWLGHRRSKVCQTSILCFWDCGSLVCSIVAARDEYLPLY